MRSWVAHFSLQTLLTASRSSGFLHSFPELFMLIKKSHLFYSLQNMLSNLLMPKGGKEDDSLPLDSDAASEEKSTNLKVD